MPRRRLHSQGEVLERARTLREELQAALGRLPEAGGDPEVVDAIWRGEAFGTLLWALQLAELPAYDTPFLADELAAAVLEKARLREADEIEFERDSARLWHWRARTSALQARGGVTLPPRYESFDQLIAATAMRGYEQGLLPPPVRGDFALHGQAYRHLLPEQQAEAHSIAVERHHALNWLCGRGNGWDDVPLDT